MSYYIHELPGRLRINIPSLRKNEVEARKVQNSLNRMRGVTFAAVNPTTGSVLVKFDTRVINTLYILGLLFQEGYIDPSRKISVGRDTPPILTKAGRAAWKAVLGLILDMAFKGSPLVLLKAFI